MKVSHAYTGAEFEAPDDWQQVDPDDQGAARVCAIAVEPPDPDGGEESFRASWVFTAVPNAGTGLDQWQEASDVLLARSLPDFVLLDFEHVEVADQPGVRRLAHYTGPRGEALVMEQWATAVDDVGLTLTATIDALRYDAAADDLEAMAATFRVPAAGPGLTGAATEESP